MSAKKEFSFKEVDQLVFKQIEVFKSSQAYQKISDELVNLGEEYQKYVNYGLNLVFNFLPILLVIVFIFSNLSIKGDINTNKKILSLINEYNQKNNTLTIMSKNVLSPFQINSKKELSIRLNAIMSQNNINKDLISIRSFMQKNNGGITTSMAKLSFQDISLNDFTNLVGSILNKEKMKITDVEVEKIKKSNLLKGNLEINHFGKSK